ncbi:Dynein heavy chain 7, axonemal [Kappamyces sp. JEL0680]|nr:Dynein heavy chain 7, axonemal [Kappamyces sp. JEL0680]
MEKKQKTQDSTLAGSREQSRIDKGLKKDKESFRTTMVNIVIESTLGEEAELHGSMEMQQDVVLPPVVIPGKDLTEKDKIQRYYYYITNGVDTQHVAEMEDDWLENVLKLIPKKLKEQHGSVELLSREMRDDYHMSVKKAIDPREKNEYGLEEKDTMEEFIEYKNSVDSWSGSYTSSLEELSSRMFLTNPNVLEILGVWNKFKSTRLIDIEPIVLKGGSYDLKTFKNQMTSRIEKSHEKLLTTWYPAVLNVFYQGSKRKEWTSIPNDRLEAFFKTISLLMSDEIRYIVHQSALDFVAMFDTASVQTYAGLENAHGICFSMKMVLDDTRIRLEPSNADIQGTVEALLDSIFTAADGIPKVETQLFATGQTATSTKAGVNPVKPDQCIKVAFEETFPETVAKIRKTLRDRLAKHLDAPVLYLNEFDKHRSLVIRQAENDVADFLAIERSQEAMMEEVKKYRNLASNQIFAGYPFVVQFPLVELSCSEFITALSERAVALSMKVVEKMGSSNRSANAEIIKVFEEMARKVTSPPETVEEMVSLQKYIDGARSNLLRNLEEQVDEAKKK